MLTQTFQATLYGADLPLVGVVVDVYFTEQYLCIESKSLQVGIGDITMSVGGFDHNEFFLNWHDSADAVFSLKLLSKKDIAFVITNAPASLKQQFSQWHKRKLTIRLVWSSLGSIAATLLISILLIWWNYDAVVAWTAAHVSTKNELRLGNSVLEQIEAEGDIVKTGLAVDTMQTIGKQLTKNSRYEYQWLIKKDKEVNAFALPGGIVIVTSALIKKADNPNELAAVLAHEIQHIEQRHTLQSMIHSLGWAAALMVVLGDVNAATAVIVHQLGNMYFSRDKEDEADRLGVQALKQANISPDGMATFLEKLQKQHGADISEWLSSHPDTAKRIATVKTLIKEQPCTSCKSLVFDWKKIQGDKALKITD